MVVGRVESAKTTSVLLGEAMADEGRVAGREVEVIGGRLAVSDDRSGAIFLEGVGPSDGWRKRDARSGRGLQMRSRQFRRIAVKSANVRTSRKVVARCCLSSLE